MSSSEMPRSLLLELRAYTGQIPQKGREEKIKQNTCIASSIGTVFKKMMNPYLLKIAQSNVN